MVLRVSILVLMELGLEHRLKELISTDIRRFYPCFNGIRVGTELTVDEYGYITLFLSLF